MKIPNIFTFGIAFFLCTMAAFFLLNMKRPAVKDADIQLTTVELKSEIQKASEKFKKSPGFRTEPAKVLVPLLKIGMTTGEIESLLGKPDNKKVSDESTFWMYSLFYSQFIDVQFDPDNKVRKIQACAPGLGNDQSGSYLLEKNNDQTKNIIGTWVKEKTTKEGADYPVDNDWWLTVTFDNKGRFTWDSKRKLSNGLEIDESLRGTYIIERGFLISYHFDKPSKQALGKIPELFAFWPNKLLGQQTFRFQNDNLTLAHDGGKIWIYLKKINNL
jgi:hypothetical protein